MARMFRNSCMGAGHCHCNYGKWCSYIGKVKTKPLSVQNPPEEEANGKASKSKAKAKATAMFAKSKAAAAAATTKLLRKICEDKAKAKAKEKATAKAKAKTNAKAKAEAQPNMSSMRADIESLFDTTTVYRDWLKIIQDRVLKLEGAAFVRCT